MAVELALLTPVIIGAFWLLTVLCGRLVVADAQVDAAARDGARSASLARTPAAARVAADRAARRSLASARRYCRALTIHTDTSGFRPGGAVTVTVRCTLNLRDVSLLLVSYKAVEGRYTVPIDPYRSSAP